jgi:hypothetical protein
MTSYRTAGVERNCLDPRIPALDLPAQVGSPSPLEKSLNSILQSKRAIMRMLRSREAYSYGAVPLQWIVIHLGAHSLSLATLSNDGSFYPEATRIATRLLAECHGSTELHRTIQKVSAAFSAAPRIAQHEL